MQIFLVTFRCFCFILEWEIHKEVQEKVIIKKHPMVIGVTLDIPVHPWSSGLISPIFLPCFATSTVADLKPWAAGHRKPAWSFPFSEQLFPKRPRWKWDPDSDPCLKKRQFFLNSFVQMNPYGQTALCSVPMQQGVPRDSSLEGAKAAAVQGKGHSMSPSSRSRCPHIAPQVTTRHCQPCPS